MKLQGIWIPPVLLLLGVGTMGLGDKPESVAEEAIQSSSRPELGRDVVIAAIEKLGGTCRCDVLSSDRPIVRVNLSHTQVTDASLEYLKGLTNLQALHLSVTRVTDAGLEYLRTLTKLKYLSVTQEYPT